MAHRTNLVVQTLSGLPLVICFENLLQTLYYYFVHSRKRHLKFTKLAEFIQRKGNKIFQNLKTMWISMLNPIKKVMAKYKTLSLKMALDYFTN